MDKIFGDEDTYYPLRDKVFNALREAILNGLLKPGQSLIETKLAEEMGVSRTPIREAIWKLESEGLVSSVPNKGVVVKGISVQDVDDIYTIRCCLEALVARWAVARITEEELARLEESIALMEFYSQRGDHANVNIKIAEFHEIIYRATKSKTLHQILSSLQRHIQRTRTASLRVSGRAEKALSEHRAIFEAFQNRDVEAAEQVMTQHIKNCRDTLLTNKKEDEEIVI